MIYIDFDSHTPETNVLQLNCQMLPKFLQILELENDRVVIVEFIKLTIKQIPIDYDQ